MPIDNVHLAKRQVKQVSFSHTSEHQQGVRFSNLGWQTVPGAHRCDRERLVAKCNTSSSRQLQRLTIIRTHGMDKLRQTYGYLPSRRAAAPITVKIVVNSVQLTSHQSRGTQNVTERRTVINPTASHIHEPEAHIWVRRSISVQY